MKQPNIKLSLLAVSVAAALAACGGGGGGDAGTTATPTTPSTGSTTTATGPTGTTLVANTGTSSGTASNTTGTVNVGLPPSPVVPAANQVVESVAAPTYGADTQVRSFFTTVNDWRSQMRFEEENGGTRLGVGLLTQRGSLDPAKNLDAVAGVLASAPDLVSPNPAVRAAAAAAAQSSMAGLGYPVSYVIASDSANTIPLAPAQFCTKALMSSLPGAEIGVSGMRYVGLSVPQDNVGNCVMVAALESAGSWQLPPTGSSSVYPFPGKQLTLPRYYGDWASLNFASQPGHAVHVSLASVDALPFAVPGAGSGQAIATSAITINEFTLRVKGSDAVVASRIFTRAGVVAGSGVSLESTTQLQFPTSIVLIPTAPLRGETVYTATIRAVVNGRTVTRTWDFTTSI